MTQLTFDASSVKPEDASRFKAIPPGEYAVTIEEEAVKQTKDGFGAYLELKLRVSQGEHKEHVVFDRLNLKNANPKATEIGLSRLSAVCHAVNIMQLTDTNQLVGKRLLAIVRIEKDKVTGQPTDRNIVVAYDKLPTPLNAFGQPMVTPSAMAGVPGVANMRDDIPF